MPENKNDLKKLRSEKKHLEAQRNILLGSARSTRLQSLHGRKIVEKSITDIEKKIETIEKQI